MKRIFFSRKYEKKFVVAVKIKIMKRKLSAPLLKMRQKKEQLSPVPRKWNYSEMRKHI